jgi:hypothetical protein
MRDFTSIWSDLEPWLAELETEREKGAKKVRHSWIIGAVIAVVGWITGAAFGAAGIGLVAGGLIAGFVIHQASRDIRELGKTIKRGMNERMAAAFGLAYSEKPATPAQFAEFRSHGMVPNSDRRSFEDHFSGEFNGASFELYEAHLEQRRRSRRRTYYVTVFRGALIRVAFPRTIEGATLITRDKGVFNAFERWAKSSGHRGLERIGLPDPKFNSIFEVYGTDQVMARYLITPSFMERLLELEEALKGSGVRAVFDENLAEGDGRGEMLIAAATGNLFEVGSMLRPINDPTRVENLYRDVELIERIISIILEPARVDGQ